MNLLNKDEIKVIVEYIDHETMRSLATMLLDSHRPRQAVDVLNCAMDKLIEERIVISEGLSELVMRLEDIEGLSEKVYNFVSSDDEQLSDD